MAIMDQERTTPHPDDPKAQEVLGIVEDYKYGWYNLDQAQFKLLEATGQRPITRRGNLGTETHTTADPDPFFPLSTDEINSMMEAAVRYRLAQDGNYGK